MAQIPPIPEDIGPIQVAQNLKRSFDQAYDVYQGEKRQRVQNEAQLHAQLSNLSIAAGEAQREVQSLNFQKEQLEQQIQQLRESCEEHRSAASGLQVYRESLTKRNQQLEEANRGLTAQNEQLDADKRTLVAERNRLAEENKTLSEENETLGEQRVKLDGDVVALKQQVAALARDNQQLKILNTQLQQRNVTAEDQLRGNLANLQASARKLEEIEALTRQMVDLMKAQAQAVGVGPMSQFVSPEEIDNYWAAWLFSELYKHKDSEEEMRQRYMQIEKSLQDYIVSLRTILPSVEGQGQAAIEINEAIEQSTQRVNLMQQVWNNVHQYIYGGEYKPAAPAANQ